MRKQQQKLLLVHPKTARGKTKSKKKRMAIAKLFALQKTQKTRIELAKLFALRTNAVTETFSSISILD